MTTTSESHDLPWSRLSPDDFEHFCFDLLIALGFHNVDWRKIARVIDLSGLIECLTHDELPIEVEIELLELVNATLDRRDPNLG